MGQHPSSASSLPCGMLAVKSREEFGVVSALEMRSKNANHQLMGAVERVPLDRFNSV
jgi:hypothetical protein